MEISVNTEMTESNPSRGWIFYDAHCPLCRTLLAAFRPIFTRRHFKWLPLQTPGAAHSLRIPETALLEEMKLLLPNDRVLSGVDSWIFLLRSVWWLWPLGTLLALPGVHRAGNAAYRWIARNRYCFGTRCAKPGENRRHRTIPFLDLP